MFSKTILTLSLITGITTVAIANQHQNLYQTPTQNSSTQLISGLPLQQLKNIAQAITVQVQVEEDKGSGILIAHQNNTYTVITNAHVVERGSTYTIKTPDGVKHSATLVTKDGKKTGNDLALLEFNSSNNYQVGTLGNSHNLREGEQVLAAGFPYNQNNLITTRGEIALISNTPLKKGYQIGFTNQTLQGMSGGLLLNSIGEVIGVLGKGKDAIFDTAYDYQDGTSPTAAEIQRLRAVGFSIPIANLVKLSPQLASLLPRNNNGDSAIAQKPVPPRTEIPPQRAEYTGIVGKVNTIAQQITVRIATPQNPSHGSGAIIARQGNIYYVATVRHNFDSGFSGYQVITHDGEKYELKSETVKIAEGYDFAVFSFKPNREYQVATIGDYTVGANSEQVVFVSGFPGNNKPPARTITGGRVRNENEFFKKDSSSLQKNGQSLLYTNISYGGMSGSAVLDREGRLIGINTGAEGEILINGDGSYQDLVLGFSLGIPIQDVWSFLTSKTQVKTEWLEVTKNPAEEVSQSEWKSIEKQLLIVEQPKENADIAAWMNYGNQLWRYGRNREAVQAFEQVIAINPKFDKAYYAMGLAYWYQGEYQQAVNSLEKAIEINQRPYYYWRYLGYSYGELKQYDKALAAYDQAINKNNQDFILYVERGDVLNKAGRYEEAILDYSKAIKINPNHTWAYNNRGLTYSKLQQYDQAIADYTKAIELNPNDADAYYNRGNTYSKLQQYDKALADYTKALDLNPNYAKAYNNRGNTYSKLQQYDQAIADYTEAIEINPQDADAYNNRGSTYANLQQYDKALADYTQAIEINPNYADAYNNRGLTYRKLQQYDKALADYTQAIEPNPQDIDAYFNRGNTYDDLQQYDKALADYTKAIELNPQDADAYYNRGITYADSQQYDKALADYTQAIEINPKNANAYNNRGFIYYKSQKYDQALEDYSKALELNPKNANAYNNRGLTYSKLQQYDKALADFTKALDLNPKNADAYMGRGVIYAILGNFQQAKEDAAEATRLYSAQGNAQGYQRALQLLQIIIEQAQAQ